MKIDDWFDPNNDEHLKAYKYLETNGYWQKGFIPEGIEFPNGWHILLVTKIADFYIQHKLDKYNIVLEVKHDNK